MRVVFAGQIARAPVLAALKTTPGIELVELDEVRDAAAHVAGAQVLVIANPRGDQGAPLAAALRDASSTVQFIQVVSAGVDGLLPHGVPQHIRITNQGGAVAGAVAEHAMALLLALCRRLDLCALDTARGAWNAESIKKLTRSVEGSVVGVIGMGNIGREVAKRARAFGARVTGFSRAGTPLEGADQMFPLSQLADKIGELDALVVCLALTPDTRGLLDAAMLSRCKPSCLVVNVSRGEVIDAGALESALHAGTLGGAALDVTAPEPLPADSTLWSAPNLLISPHIAATGSKTTGKKIAAVVTENIRRHMAGEPLLHEVGE